MSDVITPKRPWFKRKGFIIPVSVLGGVIVLSSVINGANGDADEPVTAKPAAEVVEQEAVVEEVVPVMVTVPTDLVGMTLSEASDRLASIGLLMVEDGDGLEDPKVLEVAESGEVTEGSVVHLTVEKMPVYTIGQQNAIGKAESYLDYTAFSKSGLIDQLEYEGFSKKDAEFAVEHITVDWNEQAALKAQSYLDYSDFSKSGLADQLDYEGFSKKQIAFALKAVGF